MKKQINLYPEATKEVVFLTLKQILLIILLMAVFFIGQWGRLYQEYQQNRHSITKLNTELSQRLNHKIPNPSSPLDRQTNLLLIDNKTLLTSQLQQAEQVLQQLDTYSSLDTLKDNILINILSIAKKDSQIDKLIYNFEKQQLQLTGLGKNPIRINELATKITVLFKQASIDSLVIQPIKDDLGFNNLNRLWSFSLQIQLNLLTTNVPQQAQL